MGPSGCGKSTLLNIMAGLLKHSKGDVLLRNDSPFQRRFDMGFVFQQDNLLPWKTVIDNIATGLVIRGVSLKEQQKICRALIDKVGLTGFENYYPSEISGGMKKRTALAMALAFDPPILLMDEPFGALDAQTKLQLQDELLRIWQESRKTVVFVTHDLNEAITLADKVIVMSSRPGKIKKVYDVPIKRPRSSFDIQLDPMFFNIYREIWGDLKQEILKT